LRRALMSSRTAVKSPFLLFDAGMLTWFAILGQPQVLNWDAADAPQEMACL
jgi:hypothetical protein